MTSHITHNRQMPSYHRQMPTSPQSQDSMLVTPEGCLDWKFVK